MPEFLAIEVIAMLVAFLLWLDNRREPRPRCGAAPDGAPGESTAPPPAA